MARCAGYVCVHIDRSVVRTLAGGGGGVPTLFQDPCRAINCLCWFIWSCPAFPSGVLRRCTTTLRYERLLRARGAPATTLSSISPSRPNNPPRRSPPLIREKASHPIKINRVDRAARQVASLGRRKVPSSSEFQVRRCRCRTGADLIKACTPARARSFAAV